MTEEYKPAIETPSMEEGKRGVLELMHYGEFLYGKINSELVCDLAERLCLPQAATNAILWQLKEEGKVEPTTLSPIPVRWRLTPESEEEKGG